METAEGIQGELISTSATNVMGEEGGTYIENAELEKIEEANEMGEESATCIENAELEEIEEASEMGQESATCIEKAELEEAAEGGMEEKMQTGQFFDMSCRGFLKNLSNLFIRTYNHHDTSEYSLYLP
jgi:hypothetical protein